jgi:hypothetical protein
MRSASLRRIFWRSGGDMRGQGPASNARLAARAARSTSSASPSATRASTLPVAGSSVSNVLPDAASTHAPSMSIRRCGAVMNSSTDGSTRAASPMA